MSAPNGTPDAGETSRLPPIPPNAEPPTAEQLEAIVRHLERENEELFAMIRLLAERCCERMPVGDGVHEWVRVWTIRRIDGRPVERPGAPAPRDPA